MTAIQPLRLGLVTATVAVLGLGSAHAATIVNPESFDDRLKGVYNSTTGALTTSVVSKTEDSNPVGDSPGGSDSEDFRALYIFTLPDLGGQSVQSATLEDLTLTRNTVNNTADDSKDWNVDITAFHGNTAPGSVDASFFDTAATLVGDDVFTPADTTPTSESISNATLVSVLNDAYTAGSTYVYFRAETDYVFSSDNSWQYEPTGKVNDYSIANGTAGDDAPQLSITPIPEPASLALLGLGGLLMLPRRKRA